MRRQHRFGVTTQPPVILSAVRREESQFAHEERFFVASLLRMTGRRGDLALGLSNHSCCMKAITREWLDRASDDLAAARLLLSQEDLTNVVAFHAQQAEVFQQFQAGLASSARQGQGGD